MKTLYGRQTIGVQGLDDGGGGVRMSWVCDVRAGEWVKGGRAPREQDNSQPSNKKTQRQPRDPNLSQHLWMAPIVEQRWEGRHPTGAGAVSAAAGPHMGRAAVLGPLHAASGDVTDRWLRGRSGAFTSGKGPVGDRRWAGNARGTSHCIQNHST